MSKLESSSLNSPVSSVADPMVNAPVDAEVNAPVDAEVNAEFNVPGDAQIAPPQVSSPSRVSSSPLPGLDQTLNAQGFDLATINQGFAEQLATGMTTGNAEGMLGASNYMSGSDPDLAHHALAIIAWAQDTFSSGLVLSTSFGIQSAVMLHLVTRVVPRIPIIWIDTGYLPPETYRFAEALTDLLGLNLQVYQSPISSARMEAIHGKLWEQGTVDALNRYDQMRKVEPMQRALAELGATGWLAGLRRDQTDYRKTLEWVDRQNAIHKLYPILTWNARDIYRYLTAHDLPYHPFFDLGYTTVGDWHSSRPVTLEDGDDRQTRFQGLKQECGLHLPQTLGESQSLDSSSL
jgi:phosphoadenosine phosphosulfate reductase